MSGSDRPSTTRSGGSARTFSRASAPLPAAATVSCAEASRSRCRARALSSACTTRTRISSPGVCKSSMADDRPHGKPATLPDMSDGIVFDSPGEKVRLDRISTRPPSKVQKAEAQARFAELNEELFALQDMMWGAKTHSLLVVLQGRDAAGKDGTVKHMSGGFNPRGVSVVSFGVPTTEELRHDFLWRVHLRTPRLGEVGIFNRSHYEDVLVVRVHDLLKKSVWKARYGHINDFETVLSEHGCIILK